jgi:hypothetical protein
LFISGGLEKFLKIGVCCICELKLKVLSGSYGVLRETIHVGNLDAAGLAIHLFSLSIILYFGGK